MKRILLLLAMVGVMTATAAERPTHVYLIGDSTCANKKLEKQNPERGWGHLFRAFFDEEVVVENHAMNGRSTKSFREEGRWEPIYNGMQAGDYVLIQFGHNDEKVDRPKVGSVPEVFAENLRRYVRETREKGGTPILLTPIARRHFTEEGVLKKTHGVYPDAVRRVAEEEQVPLLEMEQLTERWLTELGDVPSRNYFVWVEAGTSPLYPDGREDNTHLNVRGAHVVARMVAAELKRIQCPLADHFEIADLWWPRMAQATSLRLRRRLPPSPILIPRWPKSVFRRAFIARRLPSRGRSAMCTSMVWATPWCRGVTMPVSRAYWVIKWALRAPRPSTLVQVAGRLKM